MEDLVVEPVVRTTKQAQEPESEDVWTMLSYMVPETQVAQVKEAHEAQLFKDNNRLIDENKTIANVILQLEKRFQEISDIMNEGGEYRGKGIGQEDETEQLFLLEAEWDDTEIMDLSQLLTERERLSEVRKELMLQLNAPSSDDEPDVDKGDTAVEETILSLLAALMEERAARRRLEKDQGELIKTGRKRTAADHAAGMAAVAGRLAMLAVEALLTLARSTLLALLSLPPTRLAGFFVALLLLAYRPLPYPIPLVGRKAPRQALITLNATEAAPPLPVPPLPEPPMPQEIPSPANALDKTQRGSWFSLFRSSPAPSSTTGEPSEESSRRKSSWWGGAPANASGSGLDTNSAEAGLNATDSRQGLTLPSPAANRSVIGPLVGAIYSDLKSLLTSRRNRSAEAGTEAGGEAEAAEAPGIEAPAAPQNHTVPEQEVVFIALSADTDAAEGSGAEGEDAYLAELQAELEAAQGDQQGLHLEEQEVEMQMASWSAGEEGEEGRSVDGGSGSSTGVVEEICASLRGLEGAEIGLEECTRMLLSDPAALSARLGAAMTSSKRALAEAEAAAEARAEEAAARARAAAEEEKRSLADSLQQLQSALLLSQQENADLTMKAAEGMAESHVQVGAMEVADSVATVALMILSLLMQFVWQLPLPVTLILVMALVIAIRSTFVGSVSTASKLRPLQEGDRGVGLEGREAGGAGALESEEESEAAGEHALALVDQLRSSVGTLSMGELLATAQHAEEKGDGDGEQEGEREWEEYCTALRNLFSTVTGFEGTSEGFSHGGGANNLLFTHADYEDVSESEIVSVSDMDEGYTY